LSIPLKVLDVCALYQWNYRLCSKQLEDTGAGETKFIKPVFCPFRCSWTSPTTFFSSSLEDLYRLGSSTAWTPRAKYATTNTQFAPARLLSSSHVPNMSPPDTYAKRLSHSRAHITCFRSSPEARRTNHDLLAKFLPTLLLASARKTSSSNNHTPTAFEALTGLDNDKWWGWPYILKNNPRFPRACTTPHRAFDLYGRVVLHRSTEAPCRQWLYIGSKTANRKSSCLYIDLETSFIHVNKLINALFHESAPAGWDLDNRCPRHVSIWKYGHHYLSIIHREVNRHWFWIGKSGRPPDWLEAEQDTTAKGISRCPSFSISWSALCCIWSLGRGQDDRICNMYKASPAASPSSPPQTMDGVEEGGVDSSRSFCLLLTLPRQPTSQLLQALLRWWWWHFVPGDSLSEIVAFLSWARAIS